MRFATLSETSIAISVNYLQYDQGFRHPVAYIILPILSCYNSLFNYQVFAAQFMYRTQKGMKLEQAAFHGKMGLLGKSCNI
jgi:hypothetical protein